MKTEKLKDRELRLRFQRRLVVKNEKEADVDNGEVEEALNTFKESITSTAVEVCGTQWCRDRQKQTGWWNDEVSTSALRKPI